MKKHFFLSGLVVCCLSFINSCKEVGPDINLHGNANSVSDTSYIESPVATPAAKTALVEEFTGVQCPNCPAGHVVVSQLQTQYGARVAAVALHANNALDQPYIFSTQNLINAYSTTLLSYLIDPGFEPNGGIDRQLFPTQSYILTDRSFWQQYVQSELALTPQVNIVLTDQYNASNNQVTVIAQVHYTANVTQPNNITIMLTEDSIITAQLNGSTIDTNYVHNNILRTILTGTTGDNVAYTPGIILNAGTVVQLVYQTTLNTLWNPKNMHVIAFVHEHATSQVVYQAAIIPLE
jgi:hypothetical protein